jgi:hypothetical protein
MSLFAKSCQWTNSTDQQASWPFLALTKMEITSIVIFNIVASGKPTMAVSMCHKQLAGLFVHSTIGAVVHVRPRFCIVLHTELEIILFLHMANTAQDHVSKKDRGKFSILLKEQRSPML